MQTLVNEIANSSALQALSNSVLPTEDAIMANLQYNDRYNYK